MAKESVPDRYFALAGRPVMQVRNAEGGQGVREMHPATGAFLPTYALYTRLREGSADLDELDRTAFLELVTQWRHRLAMRRRALPIRWTPTGDVLFPWQAEQEGQPLMLRLNPYLPDAQFSVMAADQAVDELEDWPPAWLRG
jgi:hypothetical protein